MTVHQKQYLGIKGVFFPTFDLKILRIKIYQGIGTPLQKDVWHAITFIPRGKVVTYTQIASMINRPRAVRAVASAVGKNPYAPYVPCHRVICANRYVGQYSGAGGQAQKIHLLMTEGVRFISVYEIIPQDVYNSFQNTCSVM